jgi:hypothetical protein
MAEMGNTLASVLAPSVSADAVSRVAPVARTDEENSRLEIISLLSFGIHD